MPSGLPITIAAMFRWSFGMTHFAPMTRGLWSRILFLAIASLAFPGGMAWSSEISGQEPVSVNAGTPSSVGRPKTVFNSGSDAEIHSLAPLLSEEAVRRSEDEARNASIEPFKSIRALRGRMPKRLPANFQPQSSAEDGDAVFAGSAPDIVRLCRLVI